MKKETTWLKFRHKVVYALLCPIMGLYVRLKYGAAIDRFHDRRPMLVLMNHQTAFDQFFPALSFQRPIYFLASEDIFSMGWVSDLIRWLVAPIPIKKQTTDIQAVKNCIRVAREGGTVCMAPEGNRTFHGRNVYTSPAVAGLAKKLGLPIAFFRIEGGYGVHPRWSDVVRRGKMHCYVSRVMEPEEYRSLSNDELYRVMLQELNVDEACDTGTYVHKKNAEFLERAMYVCPWCGLSEFESKDDIIRCKKCGRQIRHLPNKRLQGIGCDFPYEFVADWYDAQNTYVEALDLISMIGAPIYEETADLYRVVPCQYKERLKSGATVRLYADRITVDQQEFLFDRVTVVILGKNRLNIYDDRVLFQLRGSKHFNGLKYLNFYHRYRNQKDPALNRRGLGL